MTTQQQAGPDRTTGVLHSPKGEGRKSTQPSRRKRSDVPHHGQSLPAAGQTSTVMGCVALQVTRPIHPATWDELGGLLWAAGGAVSEGQRAVIAELITKERRRDVDAADASHAYRVMCEALTARRERCAEKLRASDEEPGASQQAGANLYLNTGTVVCVASQAAAQAFGKWIKKRHLQGPPWFKRASIPLHNKGFKLSQSERGVDCSVSLLGKDADGKRQAPIRFGVAACGGNAWSTLRKLLSGEWEARSARLVYDEEDRKWRIKVSFQRTVEDMSSGDHVLVLRRGLYRFVPMLVDDGTIPAPCDSGQSVIAFKRGLDGQRAKRRSHLTHQGRGARGHGRRRFYRIYDELKRKESNFVQTWCQQQAAHVVKMALRHGCGTILSEDFGLSEPPTHPDPFIQKLLRRFPFATLTGALQHAADKAGLRFEQVRSDHNCQRCPRCGNTDPAQHDRRRLWFVCSQCKTTGPSDLVAMWNTLVDYGIDDEAVAALAAKAEAMRKSLERKKHGQKASSEDDAGAGRKDRHRTAQGRRRRRD